MARQSFVIRSTTPQGGSYVQYDTSIVGASFGSASATGAASATYIRGNNVQTPPVLSDQIAAGNILSNAAFFKAEATGYGEVTVSWGITLYEVGPTAEPYSIQVVYSPNGCPDTIAEGEILIETRNISEYIHNGIVGEWAYYTMFIRYLSSTGDDYYEPVSKLEVLIPTDFGASADLYAKIPAYYQYLDEINNEDLKNFLSVFGWDVDKSRTMLDFVMSMKDPYVANEETLNFLAGDLGVPLTTNDLGSQRLRELLKVITTLRKRNGSEASVEAYLEAIAGSNVEIDQPTKTIKVYTQRANLLKDPRFVNGIAAGVDGGSPTSIATITYDSGVVGSTQNGGTYVGGTPTDGGSEATVTTQLWRSFPAVGHATRAVLETVNADINVKGGDVLYFSVNIPESSNSKNVQEAITNVAMYEAGGSGASATEIAIDSSPQTYGSVKYWRLVVPDSYTSYTPAVVTIEFENTYGGQPITYNDFDYALLERNYIGEYFDGDTVRGGWLLGDSGALGSISDYRWLGSANNSFSVYTTNYQKTKQVIERLLKDILPVTSTITTGTLYSNGYYKSSGGTISKTPTYSYTFDYNKIPGVT